MDLAFPQIPTVKELADNMNPEQQVMQKNLFSTDAYC